MSTFGQRLRQAIDARGPLCVGIDPHEALLRAWGLDASAAGVREFGLRTVDAARGRAGIVKPQVAFFERYGSAGFAALEEVIAAARAADLLVIADAKRGDIGTTMDGYAEAWLRPGAPLESDAVTLSPYLGTDALHAALTMALEHDKGAFVLAATSNPEAAALQKARVDEEETVAERVAHDVAARNIGAPGSLGPIGLVVGATVDRRAFGLDDIVLAGTPILAPGFGAQGAQPADLGSIFGYVASQVVASESRSVLSAGPDDLATRIEERAALYRGQR
ncbi:orotidine-5'-phosphate decarboxylase [Microbacterium dextranolyticum]|uniref:Orotidine-5'-phosphate decarboxylase n=1 Tax=Microbacterium dextranolyticum TaxID=36806 RepID=A0A9W6M6G0_9MICO|nr:orotidine-5'-phosphate decarboxylase [Microbacterium dextranolyticum]MBM7463058.1 orotidine-5'-phosphate decarboxylase [Microbacterium dextranolyticum]GLJ95837.1 orotidine 5'-phosphate decarboxylase [Microbacterium dextranolyticum]